MDAGELGRDAFNNACSPAIAAAPAAGSQDDDQATCRLCWGVEDDEEDMEGGLVSSGVAGHARITGPVSKSAAVSMQLGVRGLVAGLKLGQQLVRDHGQAVTQALVMVAEVVGRPAAQVLWIQVFTAVTFFLACELVYSALLGALLGAVVGFTQGYVMTIRHHTSLGLHLAGHLARLAVKGGLKLGRWAVGAGVLLRKLAARGLITP
ncbi:uncharacterized protein HaLaN_24964 [Haematococcus lacustris]|uniref:Uncharacterized protein n=1 Tax=Haematococcus lacustris TaxID=44745 RepID=A0A699ZW94_HAELA|nr:uncharacterized protein HaLaN_24964 [Haematococcus lacustris]